MAQRGTTVLGHYPAYVEKAAERGARRFQDELREVARHRAELERAFAPDEIVTTDAAIAEARKRRERAFLDKLKRLAEGH